MARTVYINVSLTEPPTSDLILASVTPSGGNSGGGDQTFTQAFTNSAAVNVTHNLNKRPSVTIIDSAGDEVDSTINHTSLAALSVTFSAPFTGTVICN